MKKFLVFSFSAVTVAIFTLLLKILVVEFLLLNHFLFAISSGFLSSNDVCFLFFSINFVMNKQMSLLAENQPIIATNW